MQKLDQLKLPKSDDLQRFVPPCKPEEKEAFAFAWMAKDIGQALADTARILEAEREAANPPVSVDNGETRSPCSSFNTFDLSRQTPVCLAAPLKRALKHLLRVG